MRIAYIRIRFFQTCSLPCFGSSPLPPLYPFISWRHSQAVRQRSAKPSSPVRFRVAPPSISLLKDIRGKKPDPTRDFGLFSYSQKCINKKIYFPGFDLSDLLYFATNIQKRKWFSFDFRFCFEVMVILYEKHTETSPSSRYVLLDNMYKK